MYYGMLTKKETTSKRVGRGRELNPPVSDFGGGSGIGRKSLFGLKPAKKLTDQHSRVATLKNASLDLLIELFKNK